MKKRIIAKKRSSLLELVGVLTKEEANALQKNVTELRSRMRKRVELIATKLQ